VSQLVEGRHYAIDPDSGCWLWLLSCTDDGYGRSVQGVPAHRRSFVEAGRPLTQGQPLDHLCRNRKCVNPDHLEPVTIGENNRRSRVARGIEGRDVCGIGHSLADAYVDPSSGKRSCRECRRRWSLDWYRKNRAKLADQLAELVNTPQQLAAEAEAEERVAAGDLGPGCDGDTYLSDVKVAANTGTVVLTIRKRIWDNEVEL
jgi:hypothetical protein